MTKGSENKSKCIIFLAAILAAAGAIITPAWSEEILLYTQQPFNLSDNRILVAEDVDPHSGVVWLKIYSRNETLKSALLGVGDHFGYENLNLTVSKIYAGGDRDLVELQVNKSIQTNISKDSISMKSYENNSANISSSSSALAKTPRKSPGLGVPVILLIVLVRIFIRER